MEGWGRLLSGFCLQGEHWPLNVDPSDEGCLWRSGQAFLPSVPGRKMVCPVSSFLSSPPLARANSDLPGIINCRRPQTSFQTVNISTLSIASPRWILPITSGPELCWANCAKLGFRFHDHLNMLYLLPTQVRPAKEATYCLSSLSALDFLFSLHLSSLDSRAQTF